MDEIQVPSGPIKNNHNEGPQKTFFFERSDGSIVAMHEVEAWNLLKYRQQVVGRYVQPPKLIGVSNGHKFWEAVTEAHKLNAVGKIEEALERIRQGEKEELEVARGHIEMPRNFDAIDQHRNPFQLGGNIRRL